MAAVIAAIGAASLAAVVALYRERRLELANLLVAARVLANSYIYAAISIGVSQSHDTGPEFLTTNRVTMEFPAVWAEYRGTLARHLTEPQWDIVELGARFFETLLSFLDTEGDFFAPNSVSDTKTTLEQAAKVLNAYGRRGGVFRNPGRKHPVNIPELADAALDALGRADPAKEPEDD